MAANPDICIYHGNCADGFGAAWAVWKRYGDAVEFVSGIYGEPPPDVAGKHVVMVDFSYKRPVLVQMAAHAERIVILDHHKTAQAELAPWMPDLDPEPRPPYWEKIIAIFDMERSGAQIAWDYFHAGVPRPALIDYVGDRDLWRFRLPHSREIAAWVFSYPYRFVTWEELDRQISSPDYFQGCVDQGAAIERSYQKDIAEILRQTKRSMVIGGHRVPVANIPATRMVSDATGQLAQGNPFAACYFDRADARVFSLRSHGDGLDVSEIAKAYGGGGHRNAAGFQRPVGWEGDAGLRIVDTSAAGEG